MRTHPLYRFFPPFSRAFGVIFAIRPRGGKETDASREGCFPVKSSGWASIGLALGEGGGQFYEASSAGPGREGTANHS